MSSTDLSRYTKDSKITNIIKHILWILPLIAFIAGAIYFYNYFTLQIPANNIATMDSRNIGLQISVRYNYYVDFNNINFNLQDIKDNSHEDIIRALFQYAWILRGNGMEFDHVYLCRQGERKFMIDGIYFKELGEEYNVEEPMLLVFNFPMNLYYPDGTRVYPEYKEEATGTDLVLATQQLKDFNEFMKKWMYE